MAYNYDAKQTTSGTLSGAGSGALSGAAAGAGLASSAVAGGAALTSTGVLAPIGIGLLAGGLIAGAVARGKVRQTQRAEQDAAAAQKAYDEQQKLLASKSAYDTSQMAAIQSASAAKSARRSKTIPSDPALEAAMYTGGGTSYDAWHGQVYGV